MFDGIFRKIFGKQDDSKDIAKKRLKFALVYDKLEVSDNILDDLNRDIVEVISRYFEIDKKSFKMEVSRSNDSTALVVNTPIIATKHRKPGI